MATTGEHAPGTAASVAGVDNNEWTDPDRAQVPDELYAYSTNNGFGDEVSDFLVLSNFGFEVPEDAEVLGVTVRVLKKATTTQSPGVVDEVVDLTILFVVQSDSRADTQTAWPDSAAWTTYGGPADLWGVALTPAIVNDATFAVRIQATMTAAGVDTVAEVDAVTVEVTYSDPYETPESMLLGMSAGSVSRSP